MHSSRNHDPSYGRWCQIHFDSRGLWGHLVWTFFGHQSCTQTNPTERIRSWSSHVYLPVPSFLLSGGSLWRSFFSLLVEPTRSFLATSPSPFSGFSSQSMVVCGRPYVVDTKYPFGTWCTIVLLMLLGTPISWNTAQVGPHITWIGWCFDLKHYSVQLVQSKVDKLQQLIQSLFSADAVTHKQLEQILGSLIWLTAIAKHLRPHLAAIYKNLYSPPVTLFSIPAASWIAFVHCLDSATITQPHPHFALPLQGRVVEVGHSSVQDKCDIPITPKTSKLQWVRITVPNQTHFSLTKETVWKLKWFLEILRRQVHIYPLAQPTPSILRAAADAFAEGEHFGIGGWIITAKQVVWFSEQFTMTELRHWKPGLTKDAQKYISGFEILGQLALLITATEHILSSHMQIALPTSSDNTSAESSINRQLSTKEPSATFLQFISQWALQRNVALSVSHIAGRDNSWADDLSRNRLQQWKAYPRFRLSLSTFFSIGRVVKLFPPGDHPPWSQALEKSRPVAASLCFFFFHTHRQASLPIFFE